MIKVLIVDDSVVFRKILQNALGRHPGIRVVGTANNGKDALAQIPRLRPHLLILDVEMPEMNGLQTLDEIKRRHLNVGVIMFSSLTVDGARTTIDALTKGAFDFVPKPSGQGAFAESVKNIQQELIPKINAYSSTLRQARPKPLRRGSPGIRPVSRDEISVQEPAKPQDGPSKSPVSTPRRAVLTALKPEAVAIGVSTGGPNALDQVIPKLPGNFTLPVFLVQHMPPVFTSQLAKRLNEKSRINVVEAQDRQPVLPGTVYIAPGNYHMTVEEKENQKIIRLNQSPPENSCRPSVDVLFKSIARTYGPRTLAVIMTGMGKDGLVGCRELKAKRAFIIAQDRDTCVVWGMPKFVTEEGLADKVCPLEQIAPAIMKACMRGNSLNDIGNKATKRSKEGKR